MKSLTAALTTVATAAILTVVAAPGAGAGAYHLLAQSSKGGVTAKLWLNTQTRAVHAQGLGLRSGEMVRIDAYAGITKDRRSVVAGGQSNVNLDTQAFKIHPERYSACAGSPVGGARFVCTPYIPFNG
ncbi:hypothetical protein SAMN05444920_102174 [Nonomuraea solani]|uniref:Uncharacterized protein n=1 Tax=Nonomuraea solani TaxID=1144553 RepID=A0A1H5Y7Q9_9ACTN|nr:hypothetical protein [Nonomuraea solani]SEG20109.1 hypothetical protein SAMN05444920_102174 [Nonomuraea solani]